MLVKEKEKMCEMRVLMSVQELEWFKEHCPGIKWEAGDTKIRWNANDPEEVALARKAYDIYKKKHPKALAFKVKKDDKKDAKELKEFDPNAEFIMLQDWMHKG